MFQKYALYFSPFQTPVKQELVLMLKNVKQYRQIGNILPRKTARRINIHIQNVQKKNVSGELCFVSPDTSSINESSSKR